MVVTAKTGAHLLFHLFHPTDRKSRFAAGADRIHTRRDLFVGHHLEVAAQLGIEVALHALTPKEISNEADDSCQQRGHDVAFSARAMASDTRSQFCVSAFNCFDPALVRR
jgi:hypothetical protein